MHKQDIMKTILFILLFFVACNWEPPPPHEHVPDKTEAYIMSQQFVKNCLKAPSTAKFPRAIEWEGHTTQIDSRTFLINSWVDSQNSFGAMLRTKFSCKVQYKGNDQWTCLDIDFGE